MCGGLKAAWPVSYFVLAIRPFLSDSIALNEIFPWLDLGRSQRMTRNGLFDWCALYTWLIMSAVLLPAQNMASLWTTWYLMNADLPTLPIGSHTQ
jgi:hypothetical protein